MTAAQFQAMMGVLGEIRDLLAMQTVAMETPEECQHPEDKRIDLSTFGDLDHWICRACRFDNKASDQLMS